MADWYVRFFDRSEGNGMENVVGTYSLMEPTAEIRNSEVGGFTGVIAIGQTQRGSTLPIPTDRPYASSFAPYRTNYQLWRQSTGTGVCISEGMVTSINLNFNRDTILVAGKDWLHYLQRRVYPFNPDIYIDGGWRQWPRQWPDVAGAYGPDWFENPNPIDVGIILRQLFLSMKYEPPSEFPTATAPITPSWPNRGDSTLTPGVPPFKQNVPDLGITTKYKIYPGDQTTIFDHITKLSEQVEKGFEFDILPLSREFKVYAPRRYTPYPLYHFQPNAAQPESEIEGAIIDFDWTNEGPDGTYLVGLGSGKHKTGAVWTDSDNVLEFGRMDKLYDFGELSNTDLILQMLKDQNDLHPQRKLALTLWNPEFLPLNFYTGGRPRNVIGQRVSVAADFRPFRYVDAEFRINAIKWTIDKSTNESVELELEMVYEP
jgi:hypothetical protein